MSTSRDSNWHGSYRAALVLVLALALSLAHSFAIAQAPARVPLIGLLSTHAALDDPVALAQYDSLRAGLREFGYEDGRDVRLEIVTAAGHVDRLPALAQTLVRDNVNVIVTTNELSIRTAQKATSAIPIVMAGFAGDPVVLGFVDSFRRPGGNITGLWSSPSELEAKRLEILKEALPRVTRIAVLWEDPFGRGALDALSRAAHSLNVRLDLIQVHGTDDLKSAFKAVQQGKNGAILLVWSPTFTFHRDRVAALALQARLPMVSAFASEYGAFISYGSDVNAAFRRVAYYIDRLLRGVKASDLPVEQVGKFRLVVNLKTARALGVTIPESILMRADEVIR